MNYPISLPDFEKRLKKMFLEHNKSYTKQQKKEILEEFLNGEGENFISMSYSSSCGIYSQNKDYYLKNNISQEEIINNFMRPPLNNLEMLLL